MRLEELLLPPHPKDGEGNVFTGVCPFTGGGTPVPGSFPGLWSQVLSWGMPQSWPGGTPVPAGGTQDRTGVPPQPEQDWGIPLPRDRTADAARGMPLGLSCESDFCSGFWDLNH